MENGKSRRAEAMISNFVSPSNGMILSEIDLKQYGIDSGEKITNGTVQEICAMQPFITKLDLTDCEEVSDVGLWAIARHCVQLQSLNLTGNFILELTQHYRHFSIFQLLLRLMPILVS